MVVDQYSNTILHPRKSARFFTIALIVIYGIIPATLFIQNQNPYFAKLAFLCLLACLGIFLGFNVNIFDSRFNRDSKRISLNPEKFHSVIWVSFLVFFVFTLLTAKSIPIISAIKGASLDELSLQRGEFFKGREGVESVLLYLSTFYQTALLPYSLSQLFIMKSKYRYLLLLLFLMYLISFLQKSLYLNIVIPLFYLMVSRSHYEFKKIVPLILGSFVLIYLLTVLASGLQSRYIVDQTNFAVFDYFSAGYTPSNVFELLIWRSISVPIFTATDTLRVFSEQYNNQPLFGATSTFFANIFSMERVNLERVVHAYQFGGWNDFGNSNSVYFIDAYVNFSWIGLLVFSVFIGQSLRWFSKSEDVAFKSLWLLYCFVVFSAPLTGMLLSNGYIYIFFHSLFVRLKNKPLVKVIVYNGATP